MTGRGLVAAAITVRSTDPGSPDIVAQTILDGMEKDAYRVLIGSDAKMTDFMYRLNPAYAAKMIFNQMKELLGE